MAERIEAEVAIVGGGPVALTTALLLAEAGIDVAVAEKAAGPAEDLRASTFHPPTLDMLDRIGLAAPLVAQGLVCPAWQVRLHPEGERAVFDLSALAGDTAHPYRLQAEQWKLSRLLLERLAATPARLLFGHEATALAQDEAGVTVTLAGPGGPTQLRAPWAVGADGARSVVRAALGLSFEGRTYPETTILATTPFPFEDHLEGLSNVTYCWKPGGRFSLLKVPGRWRVSIYPDDTRPLEDQLTPEGIETALQQIVPRPEPYEVGEARPYRVHQRIVPRYHVGRVALAGDAAHVNNPSGGMGLNGGIHDAFALAEALMEMTRGCAGPERLARYDRHRRPVAAEQILAQADRNRARMAERDEGRRRAILADLQAVAADPDRLRAHLRKSSMIEGLRAAAAAA